MLLLLLPFFARPVETDDCDRGNLTESELLACIETEENAKILGLLRTAGEASSYWPCLGGELSAAFERAETAKNAINTHEEFGQALTDAQAVCEPHFAAFETAFRKESKNQGYKDDILTSEELKHFVYDVWYLTAPL
jgi:hypothetical protein